MKRIFPFLVLIALNGCAVQSYHPQPIGLPDLVRQYQERSLDSPDLKGFFEQQSRAPVTEWPRKEWDYGALALAAAYFHPELEMARRKKATAQAAVATATERPNPALLLPLEYGTNIPEDEKPWTIGFGLEIPFETAGKRGYRTARAEQLLQSAQYRIDAVAWKVRSRLRAALLALHLAERRSSLLEMQIRTDEQAVALLERRRSEGAASPVDVAQHRMLLAAKMAERNAVLADIAHARADIAAAIGVPLRDVERIQIDVRNFDRTRIDLSAGREQQLALLSRPELLAALAEYEASQSALQIEIANQYPNLRIGPGYTWDAGANRFSFGAAGIDLPLFNRNEGRIAEAKALREEAASALRQVQSEILQEVERSTLDYDAARRQLKDAEEMLAAQRQYLARVRRSAEAGAADRLDLTLAERTAHASALIWEEASARVKRAIGALENAMHSPIPVFPPPLASPALPLSPASTPHVVKGTK